VSARRWSVVLVIAGPRAGTLTLKRSEQPTESELDELLYREGASRAAIYPPEEG
jgi:hypothetical protein